MHRVACVEVPFALTTPKVILQRDNSNEPGVGAPGVSRGGYRAVSVTPGEPRAVAGQNVACRTSTDGDFQHMRAPDGRPRLAEDENREAIPRAPFTGSHNHGPDLRPDLRMS